MESWEHEISSPVTNLHFMLISSAPPFITHICLKPGFECRDQGIAVRTISLGAHGAAGSWRGHCLLGVFTWGWREIKRWMAWDREWELDGEKNSRECLQRLFCAVGGYIKTVTAPLNFPSHDPAVWFFICLLLLSLWQILSVALDVLEFTMQKKLALNSQIPSCISLLNASFQGTYHYT